MLLLESEERSWPCKGRAVSAPSSASPVMSRSSNDWESSKESDEERDALEDSASDEEDVDDEDAGGSTSNMLLMSR